MQRIEVMSTEAVQDEFLEMVRNEAGIQTYSVIPQTHGSGNKGVRLGDSVWPEKNFIFICYADDQEFAKIEKIAKKIKMVFPNEGITMFSVTATTHPLDGEN